ncbi:MAG: hypothetical protein GX930_07430 [Clostridia bacterium]|nr:hypothetical protein [Clostridia bacterium]
MKYETLKDLPPKPGVYLMMAHWEISFTSERRKGSMCVGKVGNSYSQLLPQIISDSLGIALYAMFIGLLVPNVKNNIRLGAVVILAVLINVILVNFMATSWAIIFSTLLGAGIGVFITGEQY